MNDDIKSLMKKYRISNYDLVNYLPDYKFAQKVYNDLKVEMSEEKKKMYLVAIEKFRKEMLNLYLN